MKDEIIKEIDRKILRNFRFGKLLPTNLIDKDKNLKVYESRLFYISQITHTNRATNVTIALKVDVNNGIHVIRWWLLLGGFVDVNKKLSFLAFSPLTLWFWILPYLRGDYDLLDKIRSIYPSAFNDMDAETLTKLGHKAVFDAIVLVLDNNGIDTSDLLHQRNNVMNINVSGGKFQVGNIVQGSMNKVSAKLGRTKNVV